MAVISAVLALLLSTDVARAIPAIDAKKIEELALKRNEMRASPRPWVHPLHYMPQPMPLDTPAKTEK